MELLLLLILLALSAAFSGSETALFSLAATDQAKLATDHGRSGQRVLALLGRSHELLSALLIGNLLVNTAAGVVATALSVERFGPQGVAVAVPAVTLALLLFGEITPKMLAMRYRFRVALGMQPILAAWLIVTTPLVRISGALVAGVLRFLPMERVGNRPLNTGELEAACDLAVSDGTLTETEGRSLSRLLKLDTLEVSHIMTPRPEVISLERDMSLRQILATARRAGYNRYPVLAAEGQRPEGLFHLKDLLAGDASVDAPLAGSLRPLIYVPESKDVAALLAEMRYGDAHLSAVVDEHGDFTGIVTMADCLQALMGPVADSAYHDPELIPLGSGRWVISGRTDLRELQEACGIRLPASRDYVSVAGFMMSNLGRVLEPGDKVTLPEARMSVLEMTGHRVDRIQVTALGGEAGSGAPRGGAS